MLGAYIIREGNNKVCEIDFELNISRIIKMEQLYDFVTDILMNSPGELQSAPAKESIQTLSDYYESGDWLEDYELDEQRLLPPDLKRGVLSQDGLYDLLSKVI